MKVSATSLTMMAVWLALSAVPVSAQIRIGTGQPQQLYQTHCASCHGPELRGGLGGSLLEGEWKVVGRSRSFIEYVREGDPISGMPPFGATLTDAQIRSLEIYIDERRLLARQQEQKPGEGREGVFSGGGHSFTLETVVDGLSIPWSLGFLPDGTLLIPERPGSLRQFVDGQLLPPVEGLPEVWAQGQGGILEAVPHPDFINNGWIYLAFSAAADDSNQRLAMTRIVRGRIIENRWQDQETIFAAPAEYYRPSRVHFGTRIVFQDGYLFFAIGDRGVPAEAQDLTLPSGKIHRLHDDGRIPADNPFVDQPDAFPPIWTYGNRNPQGLAFHPQTGALWSSEHGPRGGDEINLIERGNNYGWPVITHGMNYDGSPITELTAAPGMEQPKLHWTPSIAVAGIAFYQGDVFPRWQNRLLAGGLASEQLHLLTIEDDEVIKDEIVMRGQGRIRHVATSPDGEVFLVLNTPDKIVRLVPTQ